MTNVRETAGQLGVWQRMAESKKFQEFLNKPSESSDNYGAGGHSKDTECSVKGKEKLQFKKSFRSVSKMIYHPRIVNRFHPTLPVLACGAKQEGILFSASDGSIPFINWKESQVKLQERQTLNEFTYFTAIEWNVHGTQLAAGDDGSGVIVWSYPQGEILFQDSLKHKFHSAVGDIQWNPYRHDVLSWNIHEKEIRLWNTSTETNLLYVFEYEVEVKGVAWISENQIALALNTGLIEIFEIDESQPTATTRIVKRLQTEMKSGMMRGFLWSDVTKYLATCSSDGWIKIWSLSNDQPIHGLECPSGCWMYCFDKTDKGSELSENFTLACGLEDGTIAIWSPLKKNEQKRHQILSIGAVYDVAVDSLSFSHDGCFLASLICDSKEGNQLIIWSTSTWMPVFIDKIQVYYPHWLSWFTMESPSRACYKLAVPQPAKRQDESYLNWCKADPANALPLHFLVQ